MWQLVADAHVLGEGVKSRGNQINFVSGYLLEETGWRHSTVGLQCVVVFVAKTTEPFKRPHYESYGCQLCPRVCHLILIQAEGLKGVIHVYDTVDRTCLFLYRQVSPIFTVNFTQHLYQHCCYTFVYVAAYSLMSTLDCAYLSDELVSDSLRPNLVSCQCSLEE